MSGCSVVHFVDAGMDTGTVIIQAVVKINEKDTEESFSKRILKEDTQDLFLNLLIFLQEKKSKFPGRRIP